MVLKPLEGRAAAPLVMGLLSGAIRGQEMWLETNWTHKGWPPTSRLHQVAADHPWMGPAWRASAALGACSSSQVGKTTSSVSSSSYTLLGIT